MNNIGKALVLSLISIQVFASPKASFEKEKIHHINDPRAFISQSKENDYWFAYSVPAHNQNTLNCCWDQSSIKHSKVKACDLRKKNNGFVNQKSEVLTQNNNIFIHVKNQKISQILPVSEHCEIKLVDSSIAWLNDVDELKSIGFFKQLSINSSNNIADESLYAMTMHEHKKATQGLYEIALMDKNEISENAVFWLGASRKDGLNKLENLYKNLPKGQTKKHVNFALSQSSDPQSLELLKKIAINDKNNQQRSDALFWLAEKDPVQTKKIIINQLKSGDKTIDVEHSVFTLSRLAEGRGDETLFELLRGQYTKQVKKQALFWLSQSDNNETINKLQKML
jgi:hypothetical protein